MRKTIFRGGTATVLIAVAMIALVGLYGACSKGGGSAGGVLNSDIILLDF